MKELHIAPSPLTNRIFCGHVAKDGRTWLSNKTDVTGEACASVAKHILMAGKPIIVTENGKPKYELIAKELA